jgi:hypothetical protein
VTAPQGPAVGLIDIHNVTPLTHARAFGTPTVVQILQELGARCRHEGRDLRKVKLH